MERVYFHEGVRDPVSYALGQYELTRVIDRIQVQLRKRQASSYTLHYSRLTLAQIQPITLTRSIDDGSNLPSPLPPHIQPAYYAAVIAAEAIGTSGATTFSELTLGNSQLSGYAFYENGALKRALLINLVAFNGDGAARSAVHVALGGSGNMTIKRLSIPCVPYRYEMVVLSS